MLAWRLAAVAMDRWAAILVAELASGPSYSPIAWPSLANPEEVIMN